jgi:hypothetical protein
VAAFDGGRVSSDAGALLLGRTDRAIGLIDRLAGCFRDGRTPLAIEHTVRTLVAQRVLGIAAGYEDLNDHDALRSDPCESWICRYTAASARGPTHLARSQAVQVALPNAHFDSLGLFPQL